MPLFEVLMPPDSADPFAAELVRDKFSWSAALVPPLWAILNGLWLEMFAWGLATLLIVVAGAFFGGEAAVWLYVLMALWFGFSAADLRIAALMRSGYVAAGARIASDEMLAERDFLLERAP